MAKYIKTGNGSNSLKPKRFYEELAEYGILEDYLLERHADKYRNDIEFREEMREIMFQHSKKSVADIEILNLERLCEALGYFMEYTRQCRNQKL